jgi:anti-sigma B factor antagonist
MPDLAFAEETVDGGVHVIRLRGELDLAGARIFEPVLMSAAEQEEAVVLDCGELTFIDSTGMGLILSALRVLGRHGGSLAIACRNPTVLRLFAVTRMDETIPIAPTREGALEAARA